MQLAAQDVVLLTAEISRGVKQYRLRVKAGVTHDRLLRQTHPVTSLHPQSVGEFEGYNGFAAATDCTDNQTRGLSLEKGKNSRWAWEASPASDVFRRIDSRTKQSSNINDSGSMVCEPQEAWSSSARSF